MFTNAIIQRYIVRGTVCVKMNMLNYQHTHTHIYTHTGREGDQWGDLGVDGLIKLRWISRRWDVGIWTGLGWSGIGTGGGGL